MAIAMLPDTWCNEPLTWMVMFFIFFVSATVCVLFTSLIVPVAAPARYLAHWMNHAEENHTWAWKY